jgi:glycerol-3-phosphate dehydrogenase subunit B
LAGVKAFYHHRVLTVEQVKNGRFVLGAEDTEPKTNIIADRVLLATGRFFGRGLDARREGIRKVFCDIPVSQPVNRSCWRRETFLNPKGHAINLVGFFPLTASAKRMKTLRNCPAKGKAGHQRRHRL